jgi:hypothetical protein
MLIFSFDRATVLQFEAGHRHILVVISFASRFIGASVAVQQPGVPRSF